MIFITGDTHRRFEHIKNFCLKHKTTTNDVMIILGDAGINFCGYWRDFDLKKELVKLPITLFCIHGNHEQRPETIDTYEEVEHFGGGVYMESEFPNLLFAKDGEIYDFDGRKCIAIGGAYSIDKHLRIPGVNWWEDEQPSEEIKNRVENALASAEWKVDIVLSHTSPFKYMPREEFLPGIDQSQVDNSTEHWLDFIEEKLSYKTWYCGHFHTSKSIDKIIFLYCTFIELACIENRGDNL